VWHVTGGMGVGLWQCCVTLIVVGEVREESAIAVLTDRHARTHTHSYPLAHSPTHSPTHPLTHSLTHSPTHTRSTHTRVHTHALRLFQDGMGACVVHMVPGMVHLPVLVD
jgi:hypothetical protein